MTDGQTHFEFKTTPFEIIVQIAMVFCRQKDVKSKEDPPNEVGSTRIQECILK